MSISADRVLVGVRIPAKIKTRLLIAKALFGRPIDQIVPDAIESWLDANKVPLLNTAEQNHEG